MRYYIGGPITILFSHIFHGGGRRTKFPKWENPEFFTKALVLLWTDFSEFSDFSEYRPFTQKGSEFGLNSVHLVRIPKIMSK